MLSVAHTKQVNIDTGTVTSDIYVRVYTTVFTSGIAAKLSPQGFTTLMALATFMNEQGECFPTQDQIAERIGVHKNTANKYINELLKVRINDKPVVTRKKVNKGNGQIFSFYTVHPLSQLAIFNGRIEPVVTVNHKIKDNDLDENKGNADCAVTRTTNNNIQSNINSSQLLKLFKQLYREKYNVDYVVSNYGREGKILKDKVVGPHPDLAKDIVTIGVTQYDQLFKSAKYPRPTIAMFTWAVNQLVEKVQTEKELDKTLSNSADLEEELERKMLEKLGRMD